MTQISHEIKNNEQRPKLLLLYVKKRVMVFVQNLSVSSKI